MKFTFYDSQDAAYIAHRYPGLHIHYNDEHIMEVCYGNNDCNACPFMYLDCSTLLLPFAKPGTSIDISIETHPEYFI